MSRKNGRSVTTRRAWELKKSEQIRRVVERRESLENEIAAVDMEIAEVETNWETSLKQRSYKLSALLAKRAILADLTKYPVRALWAEQSRLYNQSNCSDDAIRTVWTS